MQNADDIQYYLNVTLPNTIVDNLWTASQFMSENLWWVFMILMLIFMISTYIMTKNFSIQERHIYDLNDFMYDYAEIDSADDAMEKLMNFRTWLKCDYIAVYKAHGETYVLLSSNINLNDRRSPTAASLHISKRTIQTYTTSGNFEITTYISQDQRYFFRAYARKRVLFDHYHGFIEVLLEHYDSLRDEDENHTERMMAKTSEILYDTINSRRFGKDGYMRYVLSMVKKVTNARHIILLGMDNKVKFTLGEPAEHLPFKTFYFRDGSTKVDVYTEEPLDAKRLKNVGTFLNLTGVFMATLHDESLLAKHYIHFLEDAVALLEYEDPYKANHGEKVWIVSDEIGKALFLSMHELEALNHASRLHDIGSIGDAEDLLPNEYDEHNSYKMHPIIGSILLEPIANIYPIVSIIKYHHERYDGKGYPYEIEGSDIPKLAQILALSEYLIGLVSDSEFKKGLDYKVAIEMTKNGSGKMFDKVVVDAFSTQTEKIEKRLLQLIRKQKNAEKDLNDTLSIP